jgi:hypothetical protein
MQPPAHLAGAPGFEQFDGADDVVGARECRRSPPRKIVARLNLGRPIVPIGEAW